MCILIEYKLKPILSSFVALSSGGGNKPGEGDLDEDGDFN